ncbi:MAG: extracellular solute-binding protein, partial [Clostridia bacterium]|nr:extracellular solute-binding protein [Clostridia bacterium]
MKHKRYLTILIGLILLLVSSCGDSNESKQLSKDEDRQKNTAITISYVIWDDALEPIYRKLADEFEKANPNIKIELEVNLWDDYWTRIESNAESGALPDVFWINGPNIIRYVEEGYIQSIEDRIINDSLDMHNYPDSLINLYTVEGIKYAMPLFWDNSVLWYNKEIFDNAHIDYPDDT